MKRNANTDPHAETHKALALAIKTAKRRLFKEHREGTPLVQAIDHFIGDIADLRDESLPPRECDACHATENLIDDGESVVVKGTREYICADCKANRDRENDLRRKEHEHTEAIEALARKAVCGCSDEEQQFALVALLNELATESNLAFVAMMAAFKDATQLQEVAIEKLTAKGASA
jgi:hypothetical protein